MAWQGMAGHGMACDLGVQAVHAGARLSRQERVETLDVQEVARHGALVGGDEHRRAAGRQVADQDGQSKLWIQLGFDVRRAEIKGFLDGRSSWPVKV
jgi:hypothetical protein